jgi:protease-4
MLFQFLFKIVMIPIMATSPLFLTTSFINFGSSNSIGLVEVRGIITEDIRKETVRNLSKFKRDKDIRAIVLRIESPGGGVSASQEIFNEVKRVKEAGKLIYASMGSIAASGGYYIAVPCDKIFANPGTATGSIGVIMEMPNVELLLKKIGIYFMVIKSEEHKDIGSPFRKMTDKEKELLKGVIDDIYNQFVNAVSTERQLKKEEVLKIADGRIITGNQAIELGLVDELGDLQDAVNAAAKAVGIKKRPKIKTPPKKRTLLEYIGVKALIDEYLYTIRLQYR